MTPYAEPVTETPSESTGSPFPGGQITPETDVEKQDGKLPQISAQLEKDLVQVFKLLADETRLKILFFLGREKELHVSALCERLGQSQPAVSHHLALLRVAGLIDEDQWR